MPKKAHAEEQIVAVLRQGEAGEKVADICRKVGISEGTYYAHIIPTKLGKIGSGRWFSGLSDSLSARTQAPPQDVFESPKKAHKKER
jgi:putative transposase